MTPLDKALFAFASYNSGAGRSRSCGEKPRSAGRIRTSGSRTSEYVAAEKIGPGNGDLRLEHLQVFDRLLA